MAPHISLGLGLFLVSYVVFCAFILYVFVIADPATSKLAYQATVVGPNKVWKMIGNSVGPRKLKVLEAIADRALMTVYLAVVLGAWTVVFWYIYPWILESPHVSNYHRQLGYFVFVACFGSWRFCSTSSPGIITKKSFDRFNHYPYDNLLFLPDRKCETTNLTRIARSKFDRLKYNANVPRYDHFCGWVFNTIGEENYRWFLLFLAIHVGMCFYGTYVCIALFHGHIRDERLLEITFFDRSTGEEFKATWFVVAQYLFARKMPECAVLIIMLVMGIALGGFLGYHCYLTTLNLTTNESQKWGDVQSWYKKEMKKYKEAVKRGDVKPPKDASLSKQSSEGPKVDLSDGDVNCTGGTTESSSSQKANPTDDKDTPSPSSSQQTLMDPGPLPKNIYNRGFVENWKEVLFPISLRKDYVPDSGKRKDT